MKNAPPPKNAGTISGFKLSTQPRFANSMNCGIIVTCAGSIIVLSTSRNNPSRNGNRSRANANATHAADSVCPTVHKSETINVFCRNRWNGNSLPISASR